MTTPHRSPWLVLAVLCLAVFTITIDTTIVNVALPTFVRDLGTSTRQLQWIVDAYNLSFAALVLACGSLGDRLGRRGMLLAGLVVFTLATAAGGFTDTPGQLVVARTLMGVGAAMIFPTTLSILTNVFTQRRQRAAAIGIWAGVTGLGVAFGPIVGGWLLEHYWWGSIFAAMVPLGVAAFLATALLVPTSANPAAPPLDLPGLLLSTLAVGSLVYTIIEAPDRGWTDPWTTFGWVVSAILTAALVGWERRVAHPMIDVRLFANARFSAASAAVAVAFFNLFGFTFLVTQYFQFLKAYSPFETGLRLIPVAVSIAAGSVLGTRLAVRLGTKALVSAGLGLLAIGYAWISTVSTATGYPEIAGQMVLLGAGLGLISAPATEAIMGVVPAAKAGVGSAVNDATRQLGGTLGVAVIGSIFASLYHRDVSADRLATLPAGVLDSGRDSIGAALAAAGQLAANGASEPAAALTAAASHGFYDGLQVACLVAAAISALAAVAALLILPSHPATGPADAELEQPTAAAVAG